MQIQEVTKVKHLLYTVRKSILKGFKEEGQVDPKC